MNAEDIERAGGPLLHYAYWQRIQDDYERRARALCAAHRTTKDHSECP